MVGARGPSAATRAASGFPSCPWWAGGVSASIRSRRFASGVIDSRLERLLLRSSGSPFSHPRVSRCRGAGVSPMTDGAAGDLRASTGSGGGRPQSPGFKGVPLDQHGEAGIGFWRVGSLLTLRATADCHSDTRQARLDYAGLLFSKAGDNRPCNSLRSC